jgi:hypothetical protein
MRPYVVAILLVPALSFGETAKFDTAVTVRVDDDNKALDTTFINQLATKQGTRADTCWHKAGRLHAKLGFDDGKVTSVDIDQLDDKAAKACITKALKSIVLANVHGHSIADVELDAREHVSVMETQNRMILDNVLDRQLSANLSKFVGIKQGEVGTGEPTGTGVGAGAGTGTAHHSSGGGIAEGDFVASDAKSPKIMVGPPDAATAPADGELSADEIDHVMRARAGIFRACYQKQLAKEPKLAGKVVIKLTVKPDGTVATAAVASTTLKSPSVEGCLTTQILRLRFPPKSTGAIIRYPFGFAQAN